MVQSQNEDDAICAKPVTEDRTTVASVIRPSARSHELSDREKSSSRDRSPLPAQLNARLSQCVEKDKRVDASHTTCIENAALECRLKDCNELKYPHSPIQSNRDEYLDSKHSTSFHLNPYRRSDRKVCEVDDRERRIRRKSKERQRYSPYEHHKEDHDRSRHKHRRRERDYNDEEYLKGRTKRAFSDRVQSHHEYGDGYRATDSRQDVECGSRKSNEDRRGDHFSRTAGSDRRKETDLGIACEKLMNNRKRESSNENRDHFSQTGNTNRRREVEYALISEKSINHRRRDFSSEDRNDHFSQTTSSHRRREANFELASEKLVNHPKAESSNEIRRSNFSQTACNDFQREAKSELTAEKLTNNRKKESSYENRRSDNFSQTANNDHQKEAKSGLTAEKLINNRERESSNEDRRKYHFSRPAGNNRQREIESGLPLEKLINNRKRESSNEDRRSDHFSRPASNNRQREVESGLPSEKLNKNQKDEDRRSDNFNQIVCNDHQREPKSVSPSEKLVKNRKSETSNVIRRSNNFSQTASDNCQKEAKSGSVAEKLINNRKRQSGESAVVKLGVRKSIAERKEANPLDTEHSSKKPHETRRRKSPANSSQSMVKNHVPPVSHLNGSCSVDGQLRAVDILAQYGVYATPYKLLNGDKCMVAGFKLVSPIADTPDHLKALFNDSRVKVNPIPMINERRALDGFNSPVKKPVITPPEAVEKDSAAPAIQNSLEEQLNITPADDSLTGPSPSKLKLNTVTMSPFKNCCIVKVKAERLNNSASETSAETSAETAAKEPAIVSGTDSTNAEHGVFTRKRRAPVIRHIKKAES